MRVIEIVLRMRWNVVLVQPGDKALRKDTHLLLQMHAHSLKLKQTQIYFPLLARVFHPFIVTPEPLS